MFCRGQYIMQKIMCSKRFVLSYAPLFVGGTPYLHNVARCERPGVIVDVAGGSGKKFTFSRSWI